MQVRVLGWIGWAGADTVGRLALLTLSTAICSRLLTPRDFGITALVLTVVTVASVLAGSPFEEALAQRRVLRKQHLRAALTASWLISAILLGLSIPLGWVLADLYQESEIAILLPIAMVSIFFSGHSDVATGLARRLHRFNEVARATLIGNVIGITLSILMALTGFGLWALIAQRVLVVIVRAIALQWLIGFLILPGLSMTHLRGMRRYAMVSLGDRLLDNMTFLAFNNLVGAFFGLTVLGYVNVAMRLVEPIRGAIGGTGHNLAFSWFVAVQDDRAKLRLRASQLVLRSSFVITPIFMGLAAVMPTLLPLVSGPNWDASIQIAICLAIGSAIVIPARLIYSAFSAKAHPELSLAGNLAGFLGTMLILLTTSSLGPISVGMSRIAGDVLQTVIAIGTSPRYLDWSRFNRFRALAPAWILSGVMGLLVAGLGAVLPAMNRSSTLAILVVAGVAIYAILLSLFARTVVTDIWNVLANRSPSRTIADERAGHATDASILVTGSDGFVGSRLLGPLAEQVGSVRAGTRRSGRTIANASIFRVACDLDDPKQIQSAVAGAELVIHAAYGSFAAMVEQCRALLQAMSDADARNLIYFSSIAVYGNRQGTISEDASVAEHSDAYGNAKARCEQLVRQWVGDDPSRRRAVILRPGIVYGTNSLLWVDKMIDRIKCGAWGTLASQGDGVAALVHVDDVVDIAVAACARLNHSPETLPPLTVVNVIGPDTPSWNDYFNALARAAGQKPLNEIPAHVLSMRRSLSVAAKVWRRLGFPGGRRAAMAPTSGELALFSRKAVYVGTNAHALFGTQPRIGLNEGLQRTLPGG